MSDNLGHALLQACTRAGSATALQAPGAVVSHQALARQAGAVAAQLRALDVRSDEPVLVRVSNQPDDIVALLGVWLAGAVAVPVHRTTPPALLDGLQQRTGARFVLARPDVGSGPGVHRVADVPPPPRPLLAGAAFILFTSGSTGEPKGVVLGHAAFLGKLRQIQRLLQFQSTDRTLLVLNLSFGFGLWVALLTLLQGGTLVLAPRFEPAAFLQVLASERITQAGLVPTMMRMLLADTVLAQPIARVAAQGSLRQLLLGGELLGQSLADVLRRQFQHTVLVNIYGLTETSTCDFFAFPADDARRPGTIGRPAPGVQHRLADADGGRVAPGDVGELQLRSPFLLAGYLDAPALTAAAHQDGWFRTGDLARQHADGLVELMGRQKELISRGGHKLSPLEVEQALGAHPDVAAALVAGVPDAVLGERIHALLVPRSGSTLSTAAMRQHLLARLEKFKHPDAWHLADALPLGRTGKADRAALPALVAAGQVRPLPP